MTKKTTKEIESNEVQVKVTAPVELTHSAFSIVYGSNGFKVVKIGFNPLTGDVGAIESVIDNVGKEQSQDVFKINVAKEIFLKQG